MFPPPRFDRYPPPKSRGYDIPDLIAVDTFPAWKKSSLHCEATSKRYETPYFYIPDTARARTRIEKGRLLFALFIIRTMYTRDVLASLAEKIARCTSCATRERKKREKKKEKVGRERATRGENVSGSRGAGPRFQCEITFGVYFAEGEGNASVPLKRRRRLQSF